MTTTPSIHELCNQIVQKELTQQPFADRYEELHECVGAGASGQIVKIRDKQTHIIYALKTLPFSTPKEKQETFREVGIHILLSKACNSGQISEIHEVYCNVVNKQAKFLVVMKLYHENLLHYILRRQVGNTRYPQVPSFSEREASALVKQISEALHFMHSGYGESMSLNEKIAHRDLKPENILIPHSFNLNCNKREKKLVLTDFGFAKYEQCKAPSTGQMKNCLKSAKYTPCYVAPEVIEIIHSEGQCSNPYDVGCDIWALGVIMYILVLDENPFESQSAQAADDKISPSMKEQLLNGCFSLDEEMLALISEPARDLLTSMLTVDAKDRITIAGVLAHPWITREGDVNESPQHASRTSVVTATVEARLNLAKISMQMEQSLKTLRCDPADRITIPPVDQIKIGRTRRKTRGSTSEVPYDERMKKPALN